MSIKQNQGRRRKPEKQRAAQNKDTGPAKPKGTKWGNRGLFIILLLSLTAYLPALQNGILYWDDDVLVRDYTEIQELNKENLVKIFTTSHGGLYHPLTSLSLAVDYKLAQLEMPWVYHFSNIILHLLITSLVFLFIRELSRKPLIGLVAALFFGVHTFHVESVAWISQRKDLMFMLFYMASLMVYLRFLKKRKNDHYTLALLLFILSLLSKTQAMTLSVVLVAIDYFLGRNLRSTRLWMEKAPFLALSVLFGIISIVINRGALDIIYPETQYVLWKRLFFAGHALSFYLAKLVLPIQLSAIYPYPVIAGEALPGAYYLFILPIIAAIGYFFYIVNKNRYIGFALLFFGANLFVVLQFFPNTFVPYADRYSYLPSVAWCFLLGYGYYYLHKQREKIARIAAYGLGAYALVLVAMTYQRSKLWVDTESLFQDVIEKHDDATLAYNTLASLAIRDGDELAADGRFQLANVHFMKALDYAQKSIKLWPRYSPGMYTAGKALSKMRRYQEAMYYFNLAEKHQYIKIQLFIDRGLARGQMADFEGAIADFSTALSGSKKSPVAYAHRGVALVNAGRPDLAISDFNNALRANHPEPANVYTSMGIAYRQMKQYERALESFSQALRQDADYAEAYYYRGTTYAMMNLADNACADFRRASELKYPYMQGQLQKYCR